MAQPEFVFSRLQYDSGDWDLVDPRMPSNLIDSLVAYTTLRVDPREAVVALASPAVFEAPFVYLSGHPLYRAFFSFDGPPATSFELNGWGDDLVHDYLKAIEIDGRIRVLYSNKDYGCEWDYDFRNKRFLAEDNTKFGVNVVAYAMGAG